MPDLPLYDRAGWPWWPKAPAAPELIDVRVWPRITLVTPSFNQARFLEETIRSVLLQGYPNLEYIVMDGGSTDGSLDILRKYHPWIDFWTSRPDDGQADAIYRGFEQSTGEILGWLNSDDLLLPGALYAFASYFLRRPTLNLATGGCLWIDEDGTTLSTRRGFPRYYPGHRRTFNGSLVWGFGHNQPATFWRRQAFFNVGGFDRTLFYCFDLDLILRLTRHRAGGAVDVPVACFRVHSKSKTTCHLAAHDREFELLKRRHGAEVFARPCQAGLMRAYHWRAELWRQRRMMLRHFLGTQRLPSALHSMALST